MFCSKCGSPNAESERFCRKCGTDFESLSLTSFARNSLRQKTAGESLANSNTKDPDELTGKGIGNVIIGDGFFMVAVILSVTQSSVSSLLWLFLLIPAFYFFGRGFADVLHAREIRRRQKQNELKQPANIAELSPPSTSVIDAIKKHTSGELGVVPSITERTTRKLN